MTYTKSKHVGWLRCRQGLFLAVVLFVVLGQQPVHAQHQRIHAGPLAPGWAGPGIGWNRGDSVDTSWQYHRLPNGPYVSPGQSFVGPGFFPGWWGVPGAAGSSWTNGLSLYGPPIPTYAPVPGVFGNADQSRLFFHQPPPLGGFWPGLGWAGQYSPSPRPRPTTVSVHPPALVVQPSVVVLPPEQGSGNPECIRMIVKLSDPTADLWIENKSMTAQGIERTFDSPPLEAGKNYRYLLLARWTENGKDRAESRTVLAQAGQTVQVDFTIPQDID